MTRVAQESIPVIHNYIGNMPEAVHDGLPVSANLLRASTAPGLFSVISRLIPYMASRITVDVKKKFPRSFAVLPFNDVHRCIVSPFPAERISTVRSLPFTSATPHLVMLAERSRDGELWGRE